MNASRPDPDALLDRLKREEQAATRGKLRIFFGASAGVGKTYAMLANARAEKSEGADVVVGVIETHGRRETAALLEGLEVLPTREDVEELLAAGIHVHTTLNVQHLESLTDVVGQVTGVRVFETLPDSVFDRADEVELVDLTPDELLERMSEGKVYLPEQARRAVEHFFRKGNLIALREMALRRTADRVDEQMRTGRHRRSSPAVP